MEGRVLRAIDCRRQGWDHKLRTWLWPCRMKSHRRGSSTGSECHGKIAMAGVMRCRYSLAGAWVGQSGSGNAATLCMHACTRGKSDRWVVKRDDIIKRLWRLTLYVHVYCVHVISMPAQLTLSLHGVTATLSLPTTCPLPVNTSNASLMSSPYASGCAMSRVHHHTAHACLQKDGGGADGLPRVGIEPERVAGCANHSLAPFVVNKLRSHVNGADACNMTSHPLVQLLHCRPAQLELGRCTQ